MARRQAGDHRAVLLIVDVQVGVMKAAWEAPRVIANVARVVERARAEQVPVVWVQHENHELPNGSDAWQWVPELQPAPGERLVAKHFNSAFEQTSLDDDLKALRATHVVLAGAASNWCIRATAYAALDRGFDLTLVSDAHTTESMDLDNGRRIEASQVVDELNIAMTWLEYPDRRNTTAPAETVSFAAPG